VEEPDQAIRALRRRGSPEAEAAAQALIQRDEQRTPSTHQPSASTQSGAAEQHSTEHRVHGTPQKFVPGCESGAQQRRRAADPQEGSTELSGPNPADVACTAQLRGPELAAVGAAPPVGEPPRPSALLETSTRAVSPDRALSQLPPPGEHARQGTIGSTDPGRRYGPGLSAGELAVGEMDADGPYVAGLAGGRAVVNETSSDPDHRCRKMETVRYTKDDLLAVRNVHVQPDWPGWRVLKKWNLLMGDHPGGMDARSASVQNTGRKGQLAQGA
jgi:hypothetical protein